MINIQKLIYQQKRKLSFNNARADKSSPYLQSLSTGRVVCDGYCMDVRMEIPTGRANNFSDLRFEQTTPKNPCAYKCVCTQAEHQLLPA